MKRKDARLARGLGAFSVALGLTQLLAPRWLGKRIGVGKRTTLMRALGARELAAGVVVLARPRRAWPLWVRAAGDVVDLTLLGVALGRGKKRARIATTLAMVAGVTGLDYAGARRLM